MIRTSAGVAFTTLTRGIDAFCDKYHDDLLSLSNIDILGMTSFSISLISLFRWQYLLRNGSGRRWVCLPYDDSTRRIKPLVPELASVDIRLLHIAMWLHLDKKLESSIRYINAYQFPPSSHLHPFMRGPNCGHLCLPALQNCNPVYKRSNFGSWGASSFWRRVWLLYKPLRLGMFRDPRPKRSTQSVTGSKPMHRCGEPPFGHPYLAIPVYSRWLSHLTL